MPDHVYVQRGQGSLYIYRVPCLEHILAEAVNELDGKVEYVMVTK